MRRLVLLASLAACVGGCAVPGTITYTYQNGKWTPTTATFSRDDITVEEVRNLENRLNGVK